MFRPWIVSETQSIHGIWYNTAEVSFVFGVLVTGVQCLIWFLNNWIFLLTLLPSVGAFNISIRCGDIFSTLLLYLRSFVGNIGKIRIYCNSVLLWSLWLIVLHSASQLISLFFCSFHNYRPAMSAVSCHSKLWIPLSRCITRTTRSIATCLRWMHRR